LVVLFVICLVLLAWIVVWKLEAPYVGEAAFLPHPVKLAPFRSSGDAGASAPSCCPCLPGGRRTEAWGPHVQTETVDPRDDEVSDRPPP
jgi:hypothetical protein